LSLANRLALAPRIVLAIQWAALACVAGEPSAQRESAETLVQLWPEHPVALHYAAANLQDSAPARAVELQRRALELGLDDDHGQHNLAIYLSKANDPGWIEATRRALAERPDSALRWRFLESLGAQREFETEFEEATRWLAEMPDNPWAMRAMGRSLAERNEDELARELLHRAAELQPDQADAQYDLAIVTDTDEREAECLAQLAKVFALDPTHERAHQRLLQVLQDQNDTVGQRAELERWLVHRPEDAAAWFQLAELLASGDDESALRESLRALVQADLLHGGKDPQVLKLQARVLEALGSGAAASRARERARELAEKSRR
jgi:predicted Zn-dependent protease